ncbi:hypothetical protein MSAN_00783500 [Mycena sanguinolenta]|uniref:Uncharacterized protein n=1 Tax=Mycena sanguinolenta TaxID=230812 RepID=A0A8H6YXV4_9AGAR|nr:hypothetical protein MSAN_00783500 [Mycena sanguinolenta]
MTCRRSCQLGGALLWLCAAVGATNNLGYLEQTFYFDYNIPSQAVPVPTTSELQEPCFNSSSRRITLVLQLNVILYISLGAEARVQASRTTLSPDPVAPYYLQIYTSAFVFPFIVSAGSGLSFDWEVPFGPGTLYQICMFDKSGNTGMSLTAYPSYWHDVNVYTGGCEAIYTVIANTTATPSCSNATFPLGPLDVDAVTDDGALSQYGWVDQCTDIQVTPKNGTPPYIFTVAPTLHPPHNQTGTDQSPMNWTVNLSWGSPFFISVVDTDMNFWSYGPLHSGQGTSTACLSGSKESNTISRGTAVASGIGGLAIGLIVGAAGVVAFYRQRRKQKRNTPLLHPTAFEGYSDPYNMLSPASAQYKPVPTQIPQDASFSPLPSSPSYVAMQRMQRESSNYQIEPFTPPGERRNSSYGGESGELHHSADPATGSGGSIYVVHHDAGRAPVTIYHQEGTEVVELPPRYIRDTSGSSSRTNDLVEAPRLATEGETGSDFPSDIVSPLRIPNRPRKP